MKAKHLFYAAILAMAFVAQPTQARVIKIYSHNGPSKRAPVPPAPLDTATIVPTDSVSGYPNLRVGSITWASVNVDSFRVFAAKPDMYTKLYQFNRTKAWATTGSVLGWVSTINENSDWLPDSSPCPAGWRLPTDAEYGAFSGAGGTWADADAGRGNTVSGKFFGVNHATCSLPNNMSGCVFLPAVDSRNHYSVPTDQSSRGIYWGRLQASPTSGSIVTFDASFNRSGGSSKPYGFPIHCVKDN